LGTKSPKYLEMAQGHISLSVWKGEPLGGQHSLGDPRSGNRYVLSQISFCKCVV
jgi:hypothetical protein